LNETVIAELRRQKWADMGAADIIVRDRVVHLWFSDEQSAAERQALRVAAENIQGVRRVEEHIVPANADPAVLEKLLREAGMPSPREDFC